MATGTEILVLAGAVATAFFALSINRGLKMRDDKRPLPELLWYAVPATIRAMVEDAATIAPIIGITSLDM
jgi:hypothetical protein